MLHRFRRLAVMAVLLLLLPAAAAASARSASPSAAAVLAAAKAASGGAAWDRIQGSFEHGEHGGTPYRTWLLYRRYGMRMESGEGDARRVHGFNGAVDWQSSGAGAARVSRDPAAMREAVTTAFFANGGYFFPARFPATSRYVREAADGERRFDVIEVSPRGGRPAELWFDRGTHLLARIVDRVGPPAVSIEISDYRRVGRVLVAFHAVVRANDGTILEEAHVDSVDYRTVETGLVDPPAPHN